MKKSRKKRRERHVDVNDKIKATQTNSSQKIVPQANRKQCAEIAERIAAVGMLNSANTSSLTQLDGVATYTELFRLNKWWLFRNLFEKYTKRKMLDANRSIYDLWNLFD